MLFLEKFPKLKNIAPAMYRKRREFIPADPKTQTDLNLDLPMFLYNGEESSSCIGDVVLPAGKRRIILFSSDAHLKILA